MPKSITRCLLCAVLALTGRAEGQSAAPSDWLDIARFKDYSAARSSSSSRFSESNFDTKQIVPGATLVLADLKGAGMVTHIWITVDSAEFAWPRLLRLRAYYDGALTPSVDAPLGDFFAVGHGTERNVNSLMVHNASFGRARNSYWPMPFRKGCRVTVTNEGHQMVTSFYYHVDYRKFAALPTNVGYFHAYYRQELPAMAGRNYEFLNIRGRGHYVGTVLSVVQTQAAWFGEGDDLFYVDGTERPQFVGTGTEDYFNDAWGLREADGLLTGTPIAEEAQPGARLTGYRWHIPDPIPFRRSLWVGMEHSGWTLNSDGTLKSGFEQRPDNFSSVAFWYQEGVNEDLPEPAYGYERLPFGNATALGASHLFKDVVAEKGEVSLQSLDDDNIQMISFLGQGNGARISVPIEVPDSGKFEILAIAAQAQDYGDYVVLMDGKTLDSHPRAADPETPFQGSTILRGYSPGTYLTHDVSLGMLEVTQGRHVLTFTCVGKHAQSSGYNFGLVDIVLEGVHPASLEAEDSAQSKKSARHDGAGSVGPVYRGRPLTHYLEQILDSNGTEKVNAVFAVGHFGPAGSSEWRRIASLLADSSEDVRLAAVTSLGQMTDPRVVATLGSALADEDERVRGVAAEGLRMLSGRGSAAVPQLVTALSDPVDYVRLAVAQALGAIGKQAAPAIPELAGRLQKENSGLVLLAIAEALGNMGPDAKAAIPALRDVRREPLWPPFKDEAERAIRRIEGERVPTY